MMRMEDTRLRFSQRHPLMFGVLMITMAVILFLGVTAFVRSMGWMNGGFSLGKDTLGVVHVEGMIMDSTDVVDWINTLRRNEDVKGVLLRVNSPGGAIAPSQEIYEAVKRLAAEKPVVASYATVAASGGYYASVPSQIIVANPGSITASIGVMAEFITVTEALSKLGIKPEVLTTGKYKAAGTPIRELTDEQREQLLGMMRDMHDQFVSDVAEARGMERERIEAVADGRAVTGRQALAMGLIDLLGSQQVAFDKLKAMCGIEGTAVLMEGPIHEKTFMEEILGSIHIDISGLSNSVGSWSFSYQ